MLGIDFFDIDNRTAMQKFREDHPKIATAAAASLITVGSVALGPEILVGAGFTPSGVAAGRFSSRFQILRYLNMNYLGSIAAGLQSVVYGGATTGFFSVCQSIGATWVVGSGSILSGIGFACGWRHYPTLTFTQNQNWWFQLRVGGIQ
jgi:hypothetical protein